jgi:nitrous oxide reductase
MERMWSGDASMKYQKQWIVMVNVTDEPDEIESKAYKTMGDIYLVTPDADEAYAKAKELGDSMGESFVFQGFDDTPRIGGIRWNQLA